MLSKTKEDLARAEHGSLKQVLGLWLLLLPTWIVIFAIASWITHRWATFAGRSLAWSLAAAANLLFYSVWAFVLTPAVLYLNWRIPFQLKRLHKVVPIYIAAMLFITVAEPVIRMPFQRLVYPADKNVSFGRLFERAFLLGAEDDIWIFSVITFIATVVSYYRKLRSEELKSFQLETQLTRAQLSVLKMQLQPHFLFNALHSISALMHQDVKRAEKMIACLGDLLRMSIAEGESNEVALRQELDLLEKYLEIQKLRFQQQLSVTMTIDPDVFMAAVPYFLLQPLVENGIKHGTSKQTGVGRIDIEVSRKEDQLHLRVANDVPVEDSGEFEGKNGFGLGNIRVRLQTLYGNKQHLEIRSLPGHRVEVEIAIPLRLTRQPEICSDSIEGLSELP